MNEREPYDNLIFSYEYRNNTSGAYDYCPFVTTFCHHFFIDRWINGLTVIEWILSIRDKNVGYIRSPSV